jgi:peptidoglycan/LPS O-acetylase OafA/YrhL
VAVFYLLQLYALELIFGLAIAAWLLRTRRQSAGYFAAGGLAMVAVVAVPYLIWTSTRPENTVDRTVAVLGLWLALGAITGVIAWALMQRVQPDQSQ